MPPQVVQGTGTPGSTEEEDDRLISPGRREILYEGYFYDVTDWIARHPGGKVIEFYTQTGEDASLALQQFHNRSIKKVLAILNTFKKRAATSEQQRGLSPETLKRHQALTEDFQKLHRELEEEGYFEPSIPHVIYRLSELLLIFIAVLYFYSFDNFWSQSLAVGLLALVCGRAGWVMHEGGHHSLTGHPQLDRLLQSFVFGVSDGLSAACWSSQHNRHHAMPQRLQHDVDLQTLPLLAFNKGVVKNPNDGKNFFVQHQSKLFFLADTFLVCLFWRMYLHPRYAIKKRAYTDLFFMGIHYCVCLHFGLINVLIVVWLTSIYMLGNFTLSHTSLPVTDEPLHWVEYSLLHTMDIHPSWWCDWFMGYLNFQISHHLFPTMPQFRLPLIRHRVQALAAKHKIPYKCLSYWDALKKMVQNLAEVSDDLKHMH